MKTRDIVIAVGVLLVIIITVFVLRKGKNNGAVPTATPSVVERLTQTYPSLNIPDGVERADLTDVSGGDAIGVATRTEIVANLPSGQTYQGYLENSSGKTVFLGTLHLTKSGWLLSYDSSKFPGYDKVVVSAGSKHILEGSF